MYSFICDIDTMLTTKITFIVDQFHNLKNMLNHNQLKIYCIFTQMTQCNCFNPIIIINFANTANADAYKLPN